MLFVVTEHWNVHTQFARILNRLLIPRIRMANDSHPGIVGQHSLEPFLSRFRAVCDDHHAGMDRHADAHAAAVMYADPAGASYSIEQSIEDGPISDCVASVFHFLRLAVRGCDRSAIEMVTADDDRSRDLTLRDKVI